MIVYVLHPLPLIYSESAIDHCDGHKARLVSLLLNFLFGIIYNGWMPSLDVAVNRSSAGLSRVYAAAGGNISGNRIRTKRTASTLEKLSDAIEDSRTRGEKRCASIDARKSRDSCRCPLILT